ncbi:MAG: serine/threonine protein kinase [Gemmatimonadetes bacterium]|nr:serine/threonine protein kinase [Gemmatimonadota bacterium]
MAQMPGPPAGPPPTAAAPTEPTAPGDSFAILERELRPELELLRPLGEGHTGRVFLAREPRLNRLVAVKVLAEERAADHVARARFEREARAAAALNHPNAVAVHRFGYLSSGVPFLVMQYVKGGTLDDKLGAEGVLPIPLARRVLAEIADALAAAHRSGFVHRDLRPGNVLCDEDGGRVLVTDFGLAGVLPEARGSDSRITRAGEVLGVPEYTSPEQLRGEEASEASDVYALGIVGYRLLAGEGPFRATKGSAIMAAHLREPPRPLRTLRADVDEPLADLLEHCLAKDPARRPRATIIAQALRAPQDRGTTPTPPAGTPVEGDIVQDLLGRRLPQIVAVTIGVGLAVLGFVSLLVQHSHVPNVVFEIALATFGFSIAAASVLAWFHGRPGRQRVRWLELGLLALVATAWLATCIMIGVRTLR